ncbi:hypothetical protein BDDG_03073 [Blastomyces dermatitidis ATCC 18188]|uniref:Tc1-like transposase DDE domain-containing protein n=1 Tax=Ajellomyces dermatitidis (strain ATCC 18188 / CBS 674.68) TaxID=653446 RepID=F2TA69_AJEDA|nr:hypothetical protein BDDG_03073 [Blastomyces dermatitidis ATCC 18188]
MNKKLETGVRRINLRQQTPGRGQHGSSMQRLASLLTAAQRAELIACAIKQPNTIVQEDKALSHNHHVQQLVYDKAEVQRLLWCGNSPDLDPIEPCWPWMKRYTTKKGAPKNRKDAIKAWEDCWNMLLQKQIQSRIERVPVHIQKIIELGGGNEYREGCTQQDWRQKNPQQAEQQDDELEWVEICMEHIISLSPLSFFGSSDSRLIQNYTVLVNRSIHLQFYQDQRGSKMRK